MAQTIAMPSRKCRPGVNAICSASTTMRRRRLPLAAGGGACAMRAAMRQTQSWYVLAVVALPCCAFLWKNGTGTARPRESEGDEPSPFQKYRYSAQLVPQPERISQAVITIIVIRIIIKLRCLGTRRFVSVQVFADEEKSSAGESNAGNAQAEPFEQRQQGCLPGC